MKRYIFDEVATYEEATTAGAHALDPAAVDYRYGVWKADGEIGTHSRRFTESTTWLKLTVLEGTPEAIAEAMMVMALGPFKSFEQVDEEIDTEDRRNTLADHGLSEADFR